MTNAEFNEQMRNRTPEYAVRVLGFSEAIPENISARVIGYQLAKSSTSVGANSRAFCRGGSAKEHYAKICLVEEADECLYWAKGIERLKIVSKIKSTCKK
ncbi:four helix bundle protein [Sinomicrobium pectinilyticum]|uniref:Four helix bundle protein n=1 Tax=Sinomicrobium pectinilyticum TaxID=1084421 RepID=A0A3N0ERZ0_SINP1|nr:four helix bundle protein [Sinomicrobium pectinilyticum]RNL90698.1 four helix bundle protein [Sinomicrobium pectinilyticum]